MRHMAKKKRKPLLSFTKNKLLHSKNNTNHGKSTYFYKQWSSWSNACHNIFANGFRWSSRHCEQNSGGFRLRDGANPTRSSLALKNPYSKNAYGRLGFLKSYVLPVFCSMALLLVFGIAINPTICEVGKSFALEGGGEVSNDRIGSEEIGSDVGMLEGGDKVDTDNGVDEAKIDDVDSIESVDRVDNSVSTSSAGENTKAATTSIAINWDVRDPEEQETYGNSGEVLYRYNRFSLSANKIKQYQILVSAAAGSSNKLIGYLDAEHTTPLSAEVGGISNTNGVVGSNIPENQWGYALAKGDVTSVGGLAGLSYKAIPNASESTVAYTGTEETLNNQGFTVAFGANVGANMPAGHYTAYVTVSAVMEAKEIINLGFAGYTTMQQINKSVCNNIPVGTEGRLKDTRDNKIYWVAKQDDGLCWMTQNLDYNGGGTKPANASIGSSSVGNTAYYYDFGSYVDTTPLSTTARCSNVTNMSDGMNACTGWKKISDSLITTAEIDAEEARELHYHVGNHYNWPAATDGTSLALAGTAGVATGSVCPAGWSLPLGNAPIKFQGSGVIIGYEEGTYGNLFYNRNVKADETPENNFTQKPYYFVRAGRVTSGSGLSDVGSWTEYITATGSSHQDNQSVYAMAGPLLGQVIPGTENVPRGYGLSVRCVAR